VSGRAGPTAPVRLAAATLAACLCAGGISSAQRPGNPPPAPGRAPALPPFVAQLQRDVDAVLAAPALERATWGVLVQSIATGETLYALNAGRLLLPASNMKIVTLAAAAERLGWDYRFETRLVGTEPVVDGVLDGDLVVVGSGDPTIDDWDGAASRLFAGWADSLKANGIRRIAGRIIGDDDSFDDDAWGSGWAWDDLDRAFAASVGTLQFNQNAVQLRFNAGARVQEPPSVALVPEGSGLEVRNLMMTVEPTGPLSVGIRRLIGAPAVELRGTVPLGTGPFVRNVAVANPTTYFVGHLRDALIRAGIEVTGDAVDIDDLERPPSRARGDILLVHRSDPLSSIAMTMMRLSQNLYAETLLKAIGAQRAVGTIDTGRASVVEVLTSWGLSPSELRMADGSGLSTYDLATPHLLAAILTHVWQDPRLRGPFEASLPTPGQEGTLMQRMRGTTAVGRVRAKTGSLSNVRAMSGYVWSADNEPLVFSLLVNNFNITADIVDEAMDAIAVRLTRVSRR
jgi:D-alanyl-D-alanine carboxypeptidase/D-alanyl-D-alanine-endopeptidase (penicillin-binding protein 4)